METILDAHFNNNEALRSGMPTVASVAAQLNVSLKYMSDMLRNLTGQSAQQHIHNKVIEHAKLLLTTSNLSVSEVAYQLGFEYPQSFNKLFRKKTNVSPLAYRQSFN